MCCTVRSFKGHADKYVISGACREVILSDIIATSYIWISDVIENVCQLLHKVLSKIYYFAWSTSCAVLGFKCDTWHIVWSCHDCDAATWIPFAIDVMKCLQFCKKNYIRYGADDEVIGPLTRNVKLRVAHARGMPGTSLVDVEKKKRCSYMKASIFRRLLMFWCRPEHVRNNVVSLQWRHMKF